LPNFKPRETGTNLILSGRKWPFGFSFVTLRLAFSRQHGKQIKYKDRKKESQPEISLGKVKTKVISEDPSKWSVECLQKCLLKLGQSVSGSKELLVKRIVNLKKNPLILDKIILRRKKSFKFKSRLLVRNIPPPAATWTSDSSHYPKIKTSPSRSQLCKGLLS